MARRPVALGPRRPPRPTAKLPASLKAQQARDAAALRRSRTRARRREALRSAAPTKRAKLEARYAQQDAGRNQRREVERANARAIRKGRQAAARERAARNARNAKVRAATRATFARADKADRRAQQQANRRQRREAKREKRRLSRQRQRIRRTFSRDLARQMRKWRRKEVRQRRTARRAASRARKSAARKQHRATMTRRRQIRRAFVQAARRQRKAEARTARRIRARDAKAADRIRQQGRRADGVNARKASREADRQTRARIAAGQGKIAAIIERLMALDGVEIHVGFQGREAQIASPDRASVVRIAGAHEYGVGVPERPFMRNAVAADGDRWVRQGAVVVRAVTRSPQTAETAIRRTGLVMVSSIKRSITSNTPPPNSEETIKRKGSSKTLIDTGQMLNSVRGAVLFPGEDPEPIA